MQRIPIPYSLFPIPYSLFPIPCSLFSLPCSLFPVPCSLKSINCVPHSYDNCYRFLSIAPLVTRLPKEPDAINLGKLSIVSRSVSVLSPVSESRCATTTKGIISGPKASSKAGL
ncbi:hypothetical protein BJP36_41680 [Moorena producens JHB]|uniref:Uncharacterized protein n=1 Tax=Moorena producens (strain JHB) TaxID=1454205 RepID=A0A9Q9SSK9_MOOP1|nr:hypothetical protein [Moorena producens]WAN68876.1 hypothetical protein BJP36_41680 [Moorena producens JHB]